MPSIQYLFQGQQDLQEVVEAWAQAPHIMSKHFKEAVKDRPKDFMGKFLSGHDQLEKTITQILSFQRICNNIVMELEIEETNQ